MRIQSPLFVSQCASRCTPRTSYAHVKEKLKSASRYFHRLHIVNGQPGADSLNLPVDRHLSVPLPGFHSIKEALNDLQRGKFVVVLDDEDRENEGDLIICADRVTAEQVAFMVEHTSGVICIGMEGVDLDRLRLPLMVNSIENEEALYTAFTVTVDAREGISTGISAADRALTLKMLSNPQTQPQELRRPGHIFPLRSRPGGVLMRPGHTEASVDLARLSGCYPAGALCEIVNKRDGSMARTPELLQFAKEHDLKCITIADLIRYRLCHDNLISKESTVNLSSPAYGEVQVHTFKSKLDDSVYTALVSGSVSDCQNVLCQIQRQDSIADLLGCTSSACSTSNSPGEEAQAMPTSQILQTMTKSLPGGVLILVNSGNSMTDTPSAVTPVNPGSGSREGARPLGLSDFSLAAQILASLGVESVALVTEDVQVKAALYSCGVKVDPVMRQGPSAKEASDNGFQSLQPTV
ncbi:hypothetical protein CEUSTIGMA_g2311.t1 [Chlamydomonas eustigma]|uniref:3,4-dihydroxy-2-butanone-4-phosphate synthase n=1 Tax=Chlamydomonas eustigma TaxID=1157962 RepID=A0A250WVP1_9CHLO|nr:hypothetical protein CEUSTIGMA_g2311.t1 [Chlamydomonas eustigma]|eukprot:GAX74865.1 hypothetical protein CEUSTIGMA_g2311.t1 [Chlamydomonas eustigma]